MKKMLESEKRGNGNAATKYTYCDNNTHNKDKHVLKSKIMIK